MPHDHETEVLIDVELPEISEEEIAGMVRVLIQPLDLSEGTEVTEEDVSKVARAILNAESDEPGSQLARHSTGKV